MKNGCQVRTPSSLREDGTERNAQFISALYAHFLAFSPFLQLYHTLRNFLFDLGNYSDYDESHYSISTSKSGYQPQEN